MKTVRIMWIKKIRKNKDGVHRLSTLTSFDFNP